jgi:hypothetical protein
MSAAGGFGKDARSDHAAGTDQQYGRWPGVWSGRGARHRRGQQQQQRCESDCEYGPMRHGARILP